MTLLAGEQILLNAGELMLTTHRIRFDSRTRPTITSLLLEELSVCSFRARRFRGGKGVLVLSSAAGDAIKLPMRVEDARRFIDQVEQAKAARRR